MRKRLSFIPVAVVVALALMATGALAAGGAKTASACPTQTSKDAIGRTWSWRVVLHGKVSCSEAIRTNLAYLRALRAGRCPTEICTEVTFPGGWTCSSVIPALEKKLAPVVSECERKGASFDVDKVSRPTAAPRTLHLHEFNSPDRRVWCIAGPYEVLCFATLDPLEFSNPSNNPPERSASVASDGKVTLCFIAVATFNQQCLQNWNEKAPVLHYGQQNEAAGFRCTSATNGITCIKVSGTGKAKGFRINKDEAVEVR